MSKRLLHVVLASAASALAMGIASEPAHAQSETYELFRLDAGVSGSYASAFGRGGFGAVAEPKFMIHDNIAVGARFEGEVMFGGNINTGDAGGDDVSMEMAAVAAALVKGEYLYGTGPVRPFGGLALGVYDIGSQSLGAGAGNASINQKAGRYVGIAPQIGIDLGRLRLAAAYNRILGADIEVSQSIGGVMQTASFTQSYMTFEMSFRIGGNRKLAAARAQLPQQP